MDTLQCFVMLTGAVALAITSFVKVGGYHSLVDRYSALGSSGVSDNDTCALPNPLAFQMLRGPTDKDYPWPGFLFGQSPASIWYWAADQMMVQRTLAAKSLSHAQGATLFAGVLKILPLFLIVFPGMISRVLFPEVVGCVDDCLLRCGNAAGCSNVAYPMLVVNLMPDGARGLMLSGMLAALMSDLTSIFNSASSLFTLDIWTRFRGKASTLELMIVGRAFVLAMVAVAIVWVPVVSSTQGGQLYIYIQAIAADLAPPIAAVYLLAILWKRTNEKGAFTGLMVGFALGCSRMICEFIWRIPSCGQPDTRPWFIRDVQYMYFAMFLFIIVLFVTVVVSLLTAPPESYRLVRTTYWTRYDRALRGDEGKSQKLGSVRENAPAFDSLEMKDECTGRRSIPTSVDTVVVARAPRERRRARLRRCMLWFCGFDKKIVDSTGSEHESSHLSGVDALKQTKFEKFILRFFLVAIISLAVFLFIFFSRPQAIVHSTTLSN